jgi:hypothetical protein
VASFLAIELVIAEHLRGASKAQRILAWLRGWRQFYDSTNRGVIIQDLVQLTVTSIGISRKLYYIA